MSGLGERCGMTGKKTLKPLMACGSVKGTMTTNTIVYVSASTEQAGRAQHDFGASCSLGLKLRDSECGD
jgi:hypothetical protein